MLFMAFVWENTVCVCVCVFCVEKGLFLNAIFVVFLFQGSISGGRNSVCRRVLGIAPRIVTWRKPR